MNTNTRTDLIEKRLTEQMNYRYCELKERVNENKLIIQEIRADIKKIAEKLK